MTKGVIFFTQSPHLSIWGDPSAWTNTLDKMNFDFYIMIDEEGIVPSWVETKSIEGYRVGTFDEALIKLNSIHPECDQVFLTENAITDLKDFIEPENPVYICGRDSGGLSYTGSDYEIKLSAPNLWAIECISAIWGRFQ